MRPRIVLIIVATIAVVVGLIVGGLGARDVGGTVGSAVAAAPDPPYFTDRIGGTESPVLIFSAEDWGILCNGGTADGSGDYNASYDRYFATRAAQGYNGVEVSMFSQTNLAGGKNGPDGDNVYPWGTGSLDPTQTPNPMFWARRDHFVQAAAAHGSYVFLNAGTAMLDAGAFTAKWTKAQWQAYGTFLGQRYGSYANIMWILGDDYFGTIDENLTAFYQALRAAGGTQPMSFQGYQETSSRQDIYTGSSTLWGTTHADYNWGYSYNATYDVVEKMGLENDTMRPIPYLFGDGTFLNSNTTISSDSFARRMIWWALSSGSKGFNLGDNDIWPWAAGAQAEIASASFYNTQVPAITRYWRGLPDWHRLVADTSSRLVTTGRGIHTTPIVSGGSGTYLRDDSDSYVTASRTPDGTLAVIYLSHPSTITIDESMMASGYRATWVDPASGATAPATRGSTYSSSPRGKNSAGDTDWALVLQTATGPDPSTTPPQPSSMTSPGTGHLTAPSWVRRSRAARLRARFDITYACSACGGHPRPLTIQGRLRNGSWRAIVTQWYQQPRTLAVRVPYRFRAVRVSAPLRKVSATITYARVVSNSIRVPRRPG